jgi:hypothetical protein
MVLQITKMKASQFLLSGKFKILKIPKTIAKNSGK